MTWRGVDPGPRPGRSWPLASELSPLRRRRQGSPPLPSASVCREELLLLWSNFDAKPEAKLEQIRGVSFSYSRKNWIYNHDENLFLIIIFQILMGDSAPTTFNVASPLMPTIFVNCDS